MSTNQLIIYLIITLNLQIKLSTGACKYPWQGFGVYLGALGAFNLTDKETQSTILNHLHDDLKLRNYRTEFMPQFSKTDDSYSIDCLDSQSCSWINLHSTFSRLLNQDDISLIVAIWSPPYYMKNVLRGLKSRYEQSYYYYLKNVTSMVQKRFGLKIDQISITNEPENLIATWDECPMSPNQLCRLMRTYNDPLMQMCPENAWYPVSQLYRDYRFGLVDCRSACSIISSHGYELSLNPLHNFGTVYYDLNVYSEDKQSPVWITEISSTRASSESKQMDEAIDMSISIVNFVGTTCVQRFYYWYAFTDTPSGESLIWLDQSTNQLFLPKKYFAYRHFTQASYGSIDRVDCSVSGYYYCLQFKPNGKSIWVNSSSKEKEIGSPCNLCCTSADYDSSCSETNTLPPRSICSC